MEYVAGFMFNHDRSKVALIRKNRAAWQKGFLNGIAGKINPNESQIDAMCREFEEETGIKTYYYDWTFLVELVNKNPDWSVSFYHFTSKLNLFGHIENKTDENVEIIDVDNIDNEKVIPNLRWLIRLCFDEEVCGGQIKNNAKQKS